MTSKHDLDQFVLKPANRAQEIESRKRSAEEWARWHTLDEYLKRDEEAELLDHAKNGKLITWVLAPAADPETLDFVCACETYERRVLVLLPGRTVSIPDVGYGIASVFTPREHRRRGYAGHMMSLLHFAIGTPQALPPFPSHWGTPPARVERPGIVSVLYSDVGEFYARCKPGEGSGWTITGLTTTEWAVAGDDDVDVAVGVELLSRDEAIEVTGADAELCRRDLEARGPSSRIQFAFETTPEWCWYQMSRSDLHPLYRFAPPSVWGVRVRSGNRADFIVWEYDASTKRTLVIVDIRASPDTFPILLKAVRSIARQERHELIEVWNLDEKLAPVARELGGHTYERDEHLPAVKWYGEPGEVEWYENSK